MGEGKEGVDAGVRMERGIGESEEGNVAGVWRV